MHHVFGQPMQSKPDVFGVYTREFLIPYQPISEDCQYLNVWTNVPSSADKKPVLVYIYGGGFGSNLVERRLPKFQKLRKSGRGHSRLTSNG